jgi:Fe-S-cluster containining protein
MSNEPVFEQIASDESFVFMCGPDCACFNECCRDLNQFMTPYDLLRLKIGTGLTSGALLARYINIATGPATGLPVATIAPGPGSDLPCPFVTAKGCAVYEHRPSSCRAYPLVRAVGAKPDDGELFERFFLVKEAHCKGFYGPAAHTPASWMENQGLAPFNISNDSFLSLIRAKNALGKGPLPQDKRQLFIRALYDTDGFRQDIAAGMHKQSKNLPDPATDDQSFLAQAMTWMLGVLQEGKIS